MRKIQNNLLASVLVLTIVPVTVKVSQAAIDHCCFLICQKLTVDEVNFPDVLLQGFDISTSGSGFIDRGSLCENIDHRRRLREPAPTAVHEVIAARADRVRRTERRSR